MINQHQITVTAMAIPITVTYLTAGTGTPLLLLHGLGDSAQAWERVMPMLAREHTVYALDLPGFGNSDKPNVNYSPDFFMAFVAAFLDALGIERVGVVGNSLGGLIAIRLALAAPSRVSALALISSAGLGREINITMRILTLPTVEIMLATWNRTFIGAWQWATALSLTLFAYPTRISQSWLGQIYRMALTPGYAEATVATARSTTTLDGQRDSVIMLDELPHLQMPTLVIWGMGDRVLPSHHAAAAMQRLPDGQLLLVPDCGHIPHVECAERVGPALQRFFTEHTAADVPMFSPAA
ncbi:MAG: alpha/beta fold hydrolase [Chloroflexaceae bacterium]|nr:alpha/beta fold hydrolase [Chloroflexaceae bacterium]